MRGAAYPPGSGRGPRSGEGCQRAGAEAALRHAARHHPRTGEELRTRHPSRIAAGSRRSPTARNGPHRRVRSSGRGHSASRPSSWTGSSALSPMPQITSVGCVTGGKGASSKAGRAGVSSIAGTTNALARYQLSIAVIAPGWPIRRDRPPFSSAIRRVGMLGEGAWRRTPRSPVPTTALVERGVAEAADILARLALRRVVEQRALEDEGCGALTITSRATRCGCCSAAIHAIAPPQSWPTSVKRSIPK